MDSKIVKEALWLVTLWGIEKRKTAVKRLFKK
jgi:hypothetical protein